MNKRVLFAMFMSMLTVMAIHYFSAPKEQKGASHHSVVPGQAYKIPTHAELSQPVKREVDFVDKKMSKKEELITIETDSYVASFSNYGGVISSLSFKQHKGVENTTLRTIHHKTFYEKEQGSFLVALDSETPYFYNFVDRKETPDTYEVIYHAHTKGWSIQKTYVMHKHSYKFDLLIDFKPSGDANPLNPRIFYASPFTSEVPNDAVSGAFSGVGAGKVETVAGKDSLDQAWVLPSMFGTQSKYFTHIMVGDDAHFTQRAYYKKIGEKALYSVLQGPAFDKKAQYKLSFYCGPKIYTNLVAVDERLEGLLSFGWLSWLCKILLALLSWLYSFIGNYGLAIIALTILVKVPFLPLTMNARRKMEEFQRYQPAIQRIRAKYKNDVQKQHAEMMRFYKEHNISPAAPASGCLPLVIQMPILFSLYRVLNNYLGLYQAPFFGWITDLSAKDPYYVLPILMGVAMLWQQRTSPAPDEKSRAMFAFMPIIMVAVFASFPAGLVLYWAMNSLTMIGEDYLRKAVFRNR